METNIETRSANDFQYRTTERGVAAALVALGYELLDVDRGAGQEPLFTFPASAMLFAAVEAYWQDTLSISAKRLSVAMAYLEGIIKEQQSREEVDINEP